MIRPRSPMHSRASSAILDWPRGITDILARTLAARLSDQARAHVEQGFSLEQSVKLLRSLFPERG